MPRQAVRPSSLRESVTLGTVAKAKSIAYSTLRQWVTEGRLPAYRVPGTHVLRVYTDDVEALFVPVGTPKSRD
jgi:excisionase family DNA binding protein